MERKRAEQKHERMRQLETDLTHMRLCMMGELSGSLAQEITQPIATTRNNARAAMHFLDRRLPDQAKSGERASVSWPMPIEPAKCDRLFMKA
jgi:C4-dicarboxylate-specific signal transduction histidine kinase